jgi:hypothetical protein
MADREWRGHWWIPDSPSETVPGTLVQRESDGELTLKLIGGFKIQKLTPIDEHQATISYNETFPIIAGHTSGEFFTLLDCIATSSSGSFLSSAVTQQDINARRGLRGIALSETDEKVFVSAVLNIEYLLGWTYQSTLQANIELDEWKWTGKQTAKSEPIEKLTAEHNDLKYTLHVDYNQFRVDDKPRANERSLANREWAEMIVEADEPTTFAGFDSSAKAIMDLMTLVAHAPAGIIRETMRFRPSEKHPTGRRQSLAEVEVMGRRIHQPQPLKNEKKRVDYLFTLKDAEFETVLPKWLSLHERAWLACSILFGLSYISAGYTDTRLLGAATAAESLHRALHPDVKRVSEQRFQEIRGLIMSALAGKDPKMVEARAFVHNSLYNEILYKDRLIELAESPDPDAVASLIEDVPKWAKYLKDQRNGLAHGDRSGDGSDVTRMTYDALEVTKALLGLMLLSELGLSAEMQRRATSLSYLERSVEEFNKALAQ